MTAEAQKARDAATRVIAVCDVIAQIVARGEESFLADVQAQWAAEMGLMRIGESIAKIPASMRERFAEQPWRQIIAMRNFAAHQYDDLDPHRVWRTLTRDVPRLRAYLADVVIPGM
ncbi:HepT-like ribonuclease domain-containing protein [Microbacterium sp. KSW2-29]|uniref:HepT-like ribonuclease domain-containing protein n=1 Tax=Microbacterium phycohabitans TaxID=3075993 RepID=A0ABU3SKR0_9MICO|nr:HepT-like ribonuclease domain-containing protein [Microbacterium sp. KSW2-29]MDU0345395.1 HepT-like ribonuclease domain-containing protein [Microbacterium sp. KSW2-29]